MDPVASLIKRCETVIKNLDEGKRSGWPCYNGRTQCVYAEAKTKGGKKRLARMVNITSHATPPILEEGCFKVEFPEGFEAGTFDFKGILEDLKKLENLAAEGKCTNDDGRWVVGS